MCDTWLIGFWPYEGFPVVFAGVVLRSMLASVYSLVPGGMVKMATRVLVMLDPKP